MKMDIKEILNRDVNMEGLFHNIVDVWEYISATNKSQRNLVTREEYADWLSMKGRVDSDIREIGEMFLKEEQWDEERLESVRHTLINAQDTPEDALRDRIRLREEQKALKESQKRGLLRQREAVSLSKKMIRERLRSLS